MNNPICINFGIKSSILFFHFDLFSFQDHCIKMSDVDSPEYVHLVEMPKIFAVKICCKKYFYIYLENLGILQSSLV